MYLPGTLLIWLAFALGAASTIAYALVIRGNAGAHSIARQRKGRSGFLSGF